MRLPPADRKSHTVNIHCRGLFFCFDPRIITAHP
jgi:hypothetical protein